MAGGLTISTLNDSSGVLATQNGMSGIAKAWVNFDGYNSPYSIRSSFNVSSITRTTTGRYTITFTTAMPDANYSVAGSAQNSGGINSNVIYGSNTGATALTTTSFPIAIFNSANATFDSSVVTAVVFR